MSFKGSSLFRRTWWVFGFCIVAGLVYGPAIKNRTAAIAELKFRLSEMEKMNFLACQEKEELGLHLASQSDPAWIELILLREVGVVPEGSLKVHFKK